MVLLGLLLLLCATTGGLGELLPLTASDKNDLVTTHNQLRSMVQPPAVGMTILEWSDQLATAAEVHVSKCVFKHSGNGYGENLFLTTGARLYLPGVVTAWYKETAHYDYYCNSCNKTCGHYTQVVATRSTKLGCAAVRCPSDGGAGSKLIMSCNYDPIGNIRGQRPYKVQDGCDTICSKCPDPVTDQDCNCKLTTNYTTGLSLAEEMVTVHNNLRGSVTPRAVDMETMVWDTELAKNAQTFVESCSFSTTGSRDYGENSQFSTGVPSDVSATIRGWFAEGASYDYHCNKCQRCHRYKQIVSAASSRLGCGVHTCPTVDGLPLPWTDVTIVVCLYSPRGDISGQRPYKSDEKCSTASCKNCPEECSSCQTESSQVDNITDATASCPENCSVRLCKTSPTSECRIPDQDGCVTSNCRACLELTAHHPRVPQRCNRNVRKCDNPCDNGCILTWAKCVRRSLRREAMEAKELPRGERVFQCFHPPQSDICAKFDKTD